jgi:uncharacterized membrane protein
VTHEQRELRRDAGASDESDGEAFSDGVFAIAITLLVLEPRFRTA